MYKRNFRPFNNVVMEVPQKHSTIKDLSATERPREKLLEKGAEALSVSELLAIIIGGGTTEKTAVELMEEIMEDCEGKLMTLSKMRVEELMQYKGIGEAKALSIVAAAEIGRRRLEESVNDMEQFVDGNSVQKYMRNRVMDLDHEESWALLLNNNAKLIRCVHLSSGGITETCVDTRILMRHAILANATCFILIHNHPSGRMTPSTADCDLTKKIKLAGDTMNIHMIDHVIVSDSDYYSFAENGKI